MSPNIFPTETLPVAELKPVFTLVTKSLSLAMVPGKVTVPDASWNKSARFELYKHLLLLKQS